VQQGSLYPALHRLEKRGWLPADWRTTGNVRDAKFYMLTADGKKRLDMLRRCHRASLRDQLPVIEARSLGEVGRCMCGMWGVRHDGRFRAIWPEMRRPLGAADRYDRGRGAGVAACRETLS
jgi:DNA-binding PadR family transcriptional regulator